MKTVSIEGVDAGQPAVLVQSEGVNPWQLKVRLERGCHWPAYVLAAREGLATILIPCPWDDIYEARDRATRILAEEG